MSIKAIITGLTLKMKVVLAVAAVLVVGGTAAIVGYNVTKEDAYRVLKVFEMEGASTVSREGSGDLEAYVGMNLESGDVLSVGEGSTLRIVLDNDKYVLLDSGTVLALNASGSAADSRTTIELKQGSILNEITNPLSANSSYEVNAPKATMAVRGTSFSVSVYDDEHGGYDISETTYHGLVTVSILDEDGNVIRSVDVGVDKSVAVHTSKNEKTGNPAEEDGRAEFVIIDGDGNIRPLKDGESPIQDALYEFVAMLIRNRVVESGNTNLMDIDEKVIKKIMDIGLSAGSNSRADAGNAVTETSAPVTETETAPETTVTEAEETVPETTATEAEETVPETTATEAEETVPETTVTEAETTVPETTATEAETTVPKTIETEATVPETTVTETENYDDLIITDEEEKPITRPRTEGTDNKAPVTSVRTPSIPDFTYTYPYRPITGTSAAEETTGTSAEETTVPEETSAEETTETSGEEAVYCEVSFTADGDLIYSEEVEIGGTVSTIPDIPVKDGHTAIWVYGDDAAEFTSDTVITADTVVSALYTEIPSEYATVTYYASYDKTTPIATETVKIGSRPTGSAVPKYNQGKDWLIWGFNASSLPIIEEDTEITVPYVDYSNVVEVMMVNGNRSPIINKLVLKGDKVTLPNVPTTLGGKKFIGWGCAYSGFENGSGLKPGSNGKDAVDSSYGTPTEGTLWPGDEVSIFRNSKFYAIYKEEFTVTFKIGSDVVYTTYGYAGDSISYYDASRNITLMDDYRWYYTDETGEHAFTYDVQLNGNITISAKPYTVTLISASEPVPVPSYSKRFTLKSDYGNTFECNGITYSVGDTITLTEDNTSINVTS